MTLLRAENITKRYPGVTALDNVTIEVEPGHIHCIVGENGAGKSTLVKILTGLERPDRGNLYIEDEDRTGQMSKAIAYVPQELNLFDNMTVAENIFLPFDNTGSGSLLFDRRRCEREAAPIMEKLKMESSPSDLASEISVAERQLLQIARALVGSEFRVLILDEPTASLTKMEIERLFAVLEDLKSQGRSAIFITHRLDEVMRLHDIVTVLRNGEVVGNSSGEDIDEDWIVRMMTGKGIDLNFLYRPRKPLGDRLLEVEGLAGDGFSDISFTLREGEILGFAGLVGAGRSEIMQTIFGYRKHTAGSARFLGEEWTFGNTGKAIERGLIYLSEERKSHGIFPNLSIRQNVAAGLLKTISTMGVVSDRRQREATSRIISDYKVKTASDKTAIRNLSGGNQQKVLIGRSLLANPRVLFMDEPTRGIDVNAKEEIYTLMQRIAEENRMGIVLISSELEELLRCCNRVITIYEGRMNSEIPEDQLDMETILGAIIGSGGSRPATDAAA
ncbi:sugar ABC transporter ATP-binding protein [Notoacmeibacter ruber]|uniref:Sugar ABC transporter ATP-binding protein n=1 Tax=Notoacmeibacter ruber TaxID=2670375 RepID=A0A3L7J8J4_9HYPH|nr:sugar ABC transporter ATP-binding protein [Notoacmeibacter ruber]RLQ86850.1 sugar ABC transporter ATP-binding protein [Notoacmeibacter ruber]